MLQTIRRIYANKLNRLECYTVPDISDDTAFDCENAKHIYYPSPLDCQSYYQCVDSNGPPVKLSCTDDLQFNPILQKCDEPENVANVKPECDYKSTSVIKEQIESTNAKVKDNDRCRPFYIK